MENPHLAKTRAKSSARVHRTKKRLVAIPPAVQRQLGLERRPDNAIALVSLRRANAGRWNHHYVKLTADNEFAIPADVTEVKPGDELQVKIHRIILDVPLEPAKAPRGAGLLVALAATPRPGWRTDGAENMDEYLRRAIHDDTRGS
jgi:hypothetical protein